MKPEQNRDRQEAAPRTPSSGKRFDRAFWRLPLPFHYTWGAAVFLLESLTGATNPRTFDNIRQLRSERLEHHARRRGG